MAYVTCDTGARFIGRPDLDCRFSVWLLHEPLTEQLLRRPNAQPHLPWFRRGYLSAAVRAKEALQHQAWVGG